MSKAMIGCFSLILIILKMGSERMAHFQHTCTGSYNRKAARLDNVLGEAEIGDVFGTHLTME